MIVIVRYLKLITKLLFIVVESLPKTSVPEKDMQDLRDEFLSLL
jgi:hypothetical protein